MDSKIAFTIAVIGALIGGFFTIIGTLLGYRLSLKTAATQAKHAETLADRNARRIAGAKLRAAFAPEISAISLLTEKQIEIGTVYDILKAAFSKHGVAIEEYRPFVPSESQGAYQEAWEHYYSPPEAQFQDYVKGCEEDRQLFQQRIAAIFKFTII